jgi:hypothetical protein
MIKKKRRHSPEQIVKKLRDADAMVAAGKTTAEVLQALEVSEAAGLVWTEFLGRDDWFGLGMMWTDPSNGD